MPVGLAGARRYNCKPAICVFVLQNASLADFALLTSAMHMAWLRAMSAGDWRAVTCYSIGLVYNTFPTPRLASGTKR